MANDDNVATKTDDNWFEDGKQLTDFMTDSRIADTTTRSSFEDAQAIVATFAESSEPGAWASLDRATVAERLASFFTDTSSDAIGTGYRSLDQGGLNLCGPAALVLMATGRDPAAVARYATDLFDTGSGSIGDFAVKASEELRNADFSEMEQHGRISSQAEWMMLGAIRNTVQPFWQPEWNGDPNRKLAGMTRPEELADWMRQTNIWSQVRDNGRWASNPGIPNATDLSVAEGTDTAVLIHANLLDESEVLGRDKAPDAPGWSPLDYFPNHWVVLLSEITSNVEDDALEFTVWTWASRVRLRSPRQVFIDNYFGTVSASV